MSRTARFFDIIQYLRQARTPVIAKTLAGKLEVNIRTVYRDIASLQASGIPIEGEAGVGYIMKPGFDLPPLMFTQEELEAISVGLSLLGRSGDDGLVQAGKSVVAKIANVTDSGSARAEPLSVSTWNRIPTAGLSPDDARTFIRHETELHITYKDLEGRVTERDIKPIALFYYIDVILLVAWCNLRSSFRHFRLDQLQHWEPTGHRFSGESATLREKWENAQDQ